MKNFKDLYKSKKNNNKKKEPSTEELVNKAIEFHLKGRIQEATNYYQHVINEGFNDHRVYSNYGVILLNEGKLKEAEIYTRKAIKLDPNSAEAYCNLGNILEELDKSDEAEIALCKAIEKNPFLAKAYFSLSLLKYANNNNWKDKLFSEEILVNQKEIDLIDIYFARANILEERSNFSQASKYLVKANNINNALYGSDYESIMLRIKSFERDWEINKNTIEKKEPHKTIIFIVGMPRSGKTITESILAGNDNLIKCGESSTLQRAIKQYLDAKGKSNNPNLYKLFLDNLDIKYTEESIFCTTTPMNLIYIGLIASQMPSAKIIYCYRNPLDNIKEIYKRNMGNKNTYSSSIIESANLWINIHQLMERYKKKFNSKIYYLSYDDLVTNTQNEIENLINWLGWKNNSNYFRPYLDKSTIKAAKNVDSRIINKKEISSWKNYQILLKPALKKIISELNFKKLIKY